MLKPLGTNQQHDDQDKKNITNALVTFETVGVKGVFEATMNFVNPEIVVNKSQSTVSCHILTNETDRKYFVFSCNQSALIISHLYSLSGYGLF